MQITIEIEDNSIAKQILESLEQYKNQGINVFQSKASGHEVVHQDGNKSGGVVSWANYNLDQDAAKIAQDMSDNLLCVNNFYKIDTLDENIELSEKQEQRWDAFELRETR